MNKLLLLLIFPFVAFSQKDIERYKLYPTENIYTSLLLDSQLGEIWQVSIGIDGPSSKVSLGAIPQIIFTDEKGARERFFTATKNWEEEYANSEDKIKESAKPLWKDYEIFIREIGRYKLYPTKNMYNFIMVDVVDGSTYQVQWSLNEKNRFIGLID